MFILGIETSCDETAAAVLLDAKKVLANIVSSQVEIHRKFGGVVPEIAARNHLAVLPDLVEEALKTARIGPEDLSLIAVTYGPGLIGGLLVGLSYAKAMAMGLGIDFIGVNHIEGHIYANILEHPELSPPFICLTVSGGHTALLHVEDFGQYRVLGRTQDDAAGEAFDKVARVLGLAYPGGPALEEMARTGREEEYDFPVAKTKNPFDFSFSGLKTACINLLHNLKQKRAVYDPADIAASFQRAVIRPLVDKTIHAALSTGVGTVLLSGGVVANGKLRDEFNRAAEKHGLRIFYPPPSFCTDNAAMIACAGYFNYMAGKRGDLSQNAQPGIGL